MDGDVSCRATHARQTIYDNDVIDSVSNGSLLRAKFVQKDGFYLIYVQKKFSLTVVLFLLRNIKCTFHNILT